MGVYYVSRQNGCYLGLFGVIMQFSSETITKLGMYGLLPLFIGFLFFIMWDLAKESKAGKVGTFWIFVALGAGFVGYIFKVVIQWYFERTLW